METKEQAKQLATVQALAKLKEILENNESLAKLVDGAMFATCGHEDSLGYLTNNPCGKCVRKAHKKATGK